MRKNRYESSSYRSKYAKNALDVGPAWWGVTIFASIAFVWAIAWMLTSSPI